MADTINKDIAEKFKDILGPMDPARDREVREILITARVGMLLRASFFGNLATRLKLVNADIVKEKVVALILKTLKIGYKKCE